jgi:hypothetical protein
VRLNKSTCSTSYVSEIAAQGFLSGFENQSNCFMKTSSQVEIHEIELECQGLKMTYQNEETL